MCTLMQSNLTMHQLSAKSCNTLLIRQARDASLHHPARIHQQHPPAPKLASPRATHILAWPIHMLASIPASWDHVIDVLGEPPAILANPLIPHQYSASVHTGVLGVNLDVASQAHHRGQVDLHDASVSGCVRADNTPDAAPVQHTMRRQRSQLPLSRALGLPRP